VAIKVVTVVDRAGSAGGGERFAVDVATGLDAARFDSTLCVTRPSPRETLDEVRARGVRVLELGRRSRLSLTPWGRLVALLRSERVDVLHSHKFGSNAWSAVVARAAGVPVFVAHEHSWSYTGDRLRIVVDRRVIAPRAAALVAVCEHDRSRMAEIERIDRARIAVCANGIAATRPRDPGLLRRELDVPAGVPVVGIVAGLRREKRVDLALEALARVRRDVSGVVLAIVGDGPERPRLEALARELGLGDGVRFLGWRRDATDLAAGFDVALLTSDREGCPLAVLEYMALARPIVATRVGGVPDLVRHGSEALLVEPGDAEALAAATRALLRDRRRAAGLGAAAARRQAVEFGLAHAVRRLEDLYERLLAERAA
jgi:glycosyltransferase involved in cell wall biosynthesis